MVLIVAQEDVASLLESLKSSGLGTHQAVCGASLQPTNQPYAQGESNAFLIGKVVPRKSGDVQVQVSNAELLLQHSV